MSRPRIRLLVPNDPHPMRIERDLAMEIGLNESIVLLQLEYLIGISKNERDGRIWTYQSLEGLKKDYFPWWSTATIGRIIQSLKERELIIIDHFNKLGYDRTQWYALNEVGISRLTSVVAHTDAISQNEKSISQIVDMDTDKMRNASLQNETTIPEITHEITQKKGARIKSAPHPRDLIFEVLADECGTDWSLCTEKQRGELNSVTKKVRESGTRAGKSEDDTISTVRYVAGFCRKTVYPYSEGQPLTPSAIQKYWGAAIKARNVNGSAGPAPYQSGQRDHKPTDTALLAQLKTKARESGK